MLRRILFALGCAAPLVAACASTPSPRHPSEAEVAATCARIPDEDMRSGIRVVQADIDHVEPLEEDGRGGKTTMRRLAGATLVVRATPGMTQQWLARVLDCHVARHVVGTSCPTLDCLLAMPGIETEVHATATGFAIAVRSSSAETAAEVWRRAQLLTPAPSGS